MNNISRSSSSYCSSANAVSSLAKDEENKCNQKKSVFKSVVNQQGATHNLPQDSSFSLTSSSGVKKFHEEVAPDLLTNLVKYAAIILLQDNQDKVAADGNDAASSSATSAVHSSASPNMLSVMSASNASVIIAEMLQMQMESMTQQIEMDNKYVTYITKVIGQVSQLSAFASTLNSFYTDVRTQLVTTENNSGDEDQTKTNKITQINSESIKMGDLGGLSSTSLGDNSWTISNKNLVLGAKDVPEFAQTFFEKDGDGNYTIDKQGCEDLEAYVAGEVSNVLGGNPLNPEAYSEGLTSSELVSQFGTTLSNVQTMLNSKISQVQSDESLKAQTINQIVSQLNDSVNKVTQWNSQLTSA